MEAVVTVTALHQAGPVGSRDSRRDKGSHPE